MPSVLAWVDFTEEDRRKMAEVIDLFREQDTRDELGLGAIRDGLADLMFPGTSTLQTRARYFLFIPWIYQRHESRETAGADISKRARGDEINLIEGLVSGGEHDGVIGIDKRAQLQRLASSVYWAGLGAWGIRRFMGSQEQYHRSWDSILRQRRSPVFDDDKEPLVGYQSLTWDLRLPDAPKDFLKSSSLALSKYEAEYLQQCILGLGETMLGHLVSDTKPVAESEFVWTHPEYDGFPITLQTHVDHARLFSEAMHGAALLYNLMLAQERGDDELISGYRDRFASWSAVMDGRQNGFRSWQRDLFWGLVEGTRARIGVSTRRFVDGWLDLAIGSMNPEALVESVAARALITQRERVLKRARARLGNPRALERWTGSAGAGQINYRWHRVRTIVADILLGLEA